MLNLFSMHSKMIVKMSLIKNRFVNVATKSNRWELNTKAQSAHHFIV